MVLGQLDESIRKWELQQPYDFTTHQCIISVSYVRCSHQGAVRSRSFCDEPLISAKNSPQTIQESGYVPRFRQINSNFSI